MNPVGAVPLATVLLAAAMAVGELDGDRLFEVDRGDHLTLAVLVALLSIAAYLVVAGVGAVRTPPGSSAWWGGVLLVWVGVAALWSPEPVVAVVVALGLAAMAAATARLVALGGWSTLAAAVVGAFALFSLLGVGLGGPPARPDGRLQLLALDANQLARFAAVTALCGLVLWNRGTVPWRLVGAGAAVVGTVAVIDSSSRTALAALALSAAFLAWQRLERGLVAVAVVIVVASLLLISPATLEDGATAVLGREVATGDVADFAGRTETWQAAVDVAVDRPLVGQGAGYDDEVFLAARLDGRVGWEARNAHNLFGHLLVIGGVPALLLGLAALATYLAAAWRQPLPFVDAIVVFLVVDGLSEAMITGANTALALLTGAAVVRSSTLVGGPEVIDYQPLATHSSR